MCAYAISSSEDEVYKRSRRFIKKEDSEESLIDGEDMDYEQYDSLFFDIFGTGKEYNYIYEKEEEDITDNKLEQDYLDEEECKEYVKKCISTVEYKVVEALFLGECLEYVAFHLGKSTLKEVLNVQRHVNDYKKYALLKREEKYKNANLPDTLRALKIYQPMAKSLNYEGLLSVEKFIENVISNERLNEPYGSLKENFEDSHDFNLFVHELSTNCIFVDRIYGFMEENIISYNTFDINRVVSLTKENNLHGLQKLFRSDIDTKGNEIRDKIIRRAFEKTNKSYLSELEGILLKNGQIPGNGSLQECANMLISLKGRPGKYFGLFYDKNMIFIVSYDEKGTFLEKKSFRASSHRQDALDYLYNAQNVVFCSNSPAIRGFIDALQCPCYYLPKIYSFFDDQKEFSIASNIVQCVQNPVLYFSRVLYENKKARTWKFISINEGMQVIQIDSNILTQAITIAAAYDKLDWINTLNHKYGFTFLKLIGIFLSSKGIDFTSITNLQQLNTDNFTTDQVNKIYTFFKLESSKNKLDRYNLHPRNYPVLHSIAGALASSHDFTGTQEEQLNFLFDNINLALSLNFDIESTGTFIHPLSAMGMIMHRDKFFHGVPDFMVFYDIVPEIEMTKAPSGSSYIGLASGVVIDVSETFAVVDVNNIRVYINDPYKIAIQDVVNVKITGPSYSTLNYNGSLDYTVNQEHYYKSHPLFREKVPDDMSVCIRESISNKSSCVVVSKISEGFYFQFLLKEVIVENCVKYNLIKGNIDLIYNSIDDFLNLYLYPYNAFLHKLSTFKYFMQTEKDAEDYMSEKGSYRKYCCYLDKNAPGILVVLFAEFKLNLKIELNFLFYKKKMYGSMEEFANYCKKTYPKM
ncbi:hypothetical protein EHP00_1036 [Ecytonucleospora hepatopenaei]|uniref:Spt6 SH2 domain-containing protein n=1 Tax=Ecytonucleospora hepatopenaei TaxID=646526 RepID=A0A1W0E535_9MICR|nr:hypothetical protein EHP00_1036 [Ecytonucleospora hepatopenaei]